MQVTTVALATLQGQYNTDWPLLMTGSVLAIVPMLVVFALGNRSFISGITTGSFGGKMTTLNDNCADLPRKLQVS